MSWVGTWYSSSTSWVLLQTLVQIVTLWSYVKCFGIVHQDRWFRPVSKHSICSSWKHLLRKPRRHPHISTFRQTTNPYVSRRLSMPHQIPGIRGCGILPMTFTLLWTRSWYFDILTLTPQLIPHFLFLRQIRRKLKPTFFPLVWPQQVTDTDCDKLNKTQRECNCSSSWLLCERHVNLIQAPKNTPRSAV